MVSLDEGAEASLVRFAAAAVADITSSRSALAYKMGRSRSNFTEQLKNGPSKVFLKALERTLEVELARSGEGLVPGRNLSLTSFEEEITTQGKGSDARLPAGWFTRLARVGPPRCDVEVYARGEALVALVELGGSKQDDLLRLVKREVDDTLDALLSLACVPEHEGRAIQLLARTGACCLNRVESHVWHSPLGFRTVRVLGRILLLVREKGYPEHRQTFDGVERCLYRIWSGKPPDPYRARSFWVEALRYAPLDAPNGKWTWVSSALYDRATDQSRPVRERVYAAFVLYIRATKSASSGIDPGALSNVLALANRFISTANDDDDRGLRYAGVTLRSMLAGKEAEGEQLIREIEVVEQAIKVLDHSPQAIPISVLPGMKTLLREALLTIDGTRRRRACETLRTGRLAVLSVPALTAVLINPDSPRWLREHAAFVCGYLRVPAAISALYIACVDDRQDDRRRSVSHAALWGIGDILAIAGDEIPDFSVVLSLLTEKVGESEPDVRRAATYALAMLGDPTLEGILNELIHHADQLTADLAVWGLRVLTSKGPNRKTGEMMPSTLI